MGKFKEQATSLLDILIGCRRGLGLSASNDTRNTQSFYGPDSLSMIMRHEDGLLYRITIQSVPEPAKGDTRESAE